MEEADIFVGRIFINADMGFDSKELWEKYKAKGIMASIAFNKRNGHSDSDYYFNKKLYRQGYAI